MAVYIRKPYQEIPLSLEQAVEMARIIRRPTGVRRFIHYIDINTEDGPLNFGKVIKDFQFDMIDLFQQNDRSILLASRQMSKCVVGKTQVQVRNDITGEEISTTIEDFHEMVSKKQKKEKTCV